MKLTGAEILCECLLKEKVEVIFGYPGGAIMQVYDALLNYPKIHHVLVRHEQGAAHAAQAYSRMTGKPGVCLVTSGPGATNLITGLADATMDSDPIVCISGQVHSDLLGNDAFQEADVMGITSMVTKHNYMISKPKEIVPCIKEAFYLANSGRPGPVMIDITKDAQIKKTDYSYPRKVKVPGYKPVLKGNLMQVKKAVKMINNSKKPMILAGHGVQISRAYKELSNFAKKANIPVAVTLHGISSIDTSSKYYVGMLGMHGNLAPNKCTNEADLIIAFGMRFDDRVTGRLADYARRAEIIHVDIDPAELSKNIKADVPIVGDVKHVLKQMMPFIKKRERNRWFERFAHFWKIEQDRVIEKEINPEKGKIKMGEVIRNISDMTKGEAVITSDVGQNQMMSARYYSFEKHNGYLTSGGLGTMGFALPAAVGAKIAVPHREVWAIMGDGGFQMTMQEMATIAQENLDIKIAILNNNFLGMVRQWQQLFFDRKYSEVFLKNPDFIKLSEGFGIKAQQVKKREQIEQAIKTARKEKGPFLLEFVVETEGNIFPMMPAGAAVDEINLE